MGRTTSMPKSALHYELDKARYLDLETCCSELLKSFVENEIDVQYTTLDGNTE